jgi:hypothetical protein
LWVKPKQENFYLPDWKPNAMQFFTKKTQGCNILFNSANKEIFSILSLPVICWQETMVAVRKKSFISVC